MMLTPSMIEYVRSNVFPAGNQHRWQWCSMRSEQDPARAAANFWLGFLPSESRRLRVRRISRRARIWKSWKTTAPLRKFLSQVRPPVQPNGRNSKEGAEISSRRAPKCVRYFLREPARECVPQQYADPITRAREFGWKTFLGTSGEPLRLAPAEKSYFVKPNREEAGQLLGKPVSSLSAAVSALQSLKIRHSDSQGAPFLTIPLSRRKWEYCAFVSTK
jgi:hypothetical protein